MTWHFRTIAAIGALGLLAAPIAYAFGLRADLAVRAADAWVVDFADVRAAACTATDDGVVCEVKTVTGRRLDLVCEAPGAFDVRLFCGRRPITTARAGGARSAAEGPPEDAGR